MRLRIANAASAVGDIRIAVLTDSITDPSDHSPWAYPPRRPRFYGSYFVL